MPRPAQAKPKDFTARHLAIKNSGIGGIEADNGKEHADTFRNVWHPDLRADYVLANPSFNDSDTALRGSGFSRSQHIPQVMSEAKDNFCKDDDLRWQPTGARSTVKSSPQGERGCVHQFGVPPKGDANVTWVEVAFRSNS